MSQIPNEYKCPITHEIMQVPVIAEDGITYEKHAIEQWLNNPSSRNRSPVTNSEISINGLKINYALKSMISRFLEDNNMTSSSDINVTIDNTDPIVPNKSTLAVKKFIIDDKSYLHIKVKSPDNGEIKNTLFIANIDISGSM